DVPWEGPAVLDGAFRGRPLPRGVGAACGCVGRRPVVWAQRRPSWAPCGAWSRTGQPPSTAGRILPPDLRRRHTMADAVIIDAVRTPGGKRNGKLRNWHAADLASETLKALVERNDLDPGLVDDVIMGCVMQV